MATLATPAKTVKTVSLRTADAKVGAKRAKYASHVNPANRANHAVRAVARVATTHALVAMAVVKDAVTKAKMQLLSSVQQTLVTRHLQRRSQRHQLRRLWKMVLHRQISSVNKASRPNGASRLKVSASPVSAVAVTVMDAIAVNSVARAASLETSRKSVVMKPMKPPDPCKTVRKVKLSPSNRGLKQLLIL